MRRLLACSLAAGVSIANPLGLVDHSLALLTPSSADAAVAVAHTLEELVIHSPRVVVGKALARTSRWEHVAGSKRIVSYTKFRVQENVYGAGDAEISVRTLGGEVGRIGQQVSGEASLAVGDKAVLFLTQAPDLAWVVTGMAQGHYPVRAEARKQAEPPPPERLRFSPTIAALLPRRGPSIPAHEHLVGKTLSESVHAIRKVKAEIDARKQP